MTLAFDRWATLGQSFFNGHRRIWSYAPGVIQKELLRQSDEGRLILMQRYHPDGKTELVGALRRPAKGRRA